MNGGLFLAFVAALTIAEFLIGLRFARMADLRPEELPANFRTTTTPAQIGRFGRLLMISSIAFFLIAAAICTGLFGPIDGITPIQFATE